MLKIKRLKWEDVVGELEKGEFEEIVKEISNRIKDIIYMDVEHKVRKIVYNTIALNPFVDQDIEITWTIRLNVSDLVQIVGRIRRSKEKPK